VVRELFERGGIEDWEMATHPQRHVLTSSIQDCPEVPKVFFREIEILSGDSCLLCTDGVWEAVSQTEMELIARAVPLPEAGRTLAAALQGRECRDNVTFAWLY
jgi:serine/threonine protein phosphatase PrpC